MLLFWQRPLNENTSISTAAVQASFEWLAYTVAGACDTINTVARIFHMHSGMGGYALTDSEAQKFTRVKFLTLTLTLTLG